MYAASTSLTMNTAREAPKNRHSKQKPTINTFRNISGPMMIASDPIGSNGLRCTRTGGPRTGSRFGCSRPLPAGFCSAFRNGMICTKISTSPCICSFFDGWYKGTHSPCVSPSIKLPNFVPNPLPSSGWSFFEISAYAFSPSSPSGLKSIARIKSLHSPVSGTTASPMLSLEPITSLS